MYFWKSSFVGGKPKSESRYLWLTLWCPDIQHNDIQHNDIQHNDIQHERLIYCQHSEGMKLLSINDTQHNNTFIMLTVAFYVLSCWVALSWMSLCWVSWRQHRYGSLNNFIIQSYIDCYSWYWQLNGEIVSYNWCIRAELQIFQYRK